MTTFSTTYLSKICFKRLVKGFVDFTNNDVIQPARMILNVQDKNMFLVKPVISLPEDSIATKLLTIYPENEEIQ